MRSANDGEQNRKCISNICERRQRPGSVAQQVDTGNEIFVRQCVHNSRELGGFDDRMDMWLEGINFVHDRHGSLRRALSRQDLIELFVDGPAHQAAKVNIIVIADSADASAVDVEVDDVSLRIGTPAGKIADAQRAG